MTAYPKTKAGIPADVDALWVLKAAAMMVEGDRTAALSTVYLRRGDSGNWVAFSPDLDGVTGTGKGCDDAVSQLLSRALEIDGAHAGTVAEGEKLTADDAAALTELIESESAGTDTPEPAPAGKKGKRKSKSAQITEAGDKALAARERAEAREALTREAAEREARVNAEAAKAAKAAKSQKSGKAAKAEKGDKSAPVKPAPEAPKVAPSPQPEGKGEAPAQSRPEKAERVKAGRDAAVAAERERLAAQKKAREESAPVALGAEGIEYAARRILQTYRRSAAQCSAAQTQDLDAYEAADRIADHIEAVAALRDDCDAPVVRELTDDVLILMERHSLLARGERPDMDAYDAHRVRSRVRKAQRRYADR